MEIKCQLDATEVFIADLIACSTCFRHHYAHHQELKSIIQWLLPVLFRAVVFKLLVWCGAEGYVSGFQDACWFVCWKFIIYCSCNISYYVPTYTREEVMKFEMCACTVTFGDFWFTTIWCTQANR